jgi:NTE family protein
LLGAPHLLEDVITTMVVGRDQAYLNQPWVDARTIRVDSTDVGFLDFDITENEVEAQYLKGHAAAERFLTEWNWASYLRRFR